MHGVHVCYRIAHLSSTSFCELSASRLGACGRSQQWNVLGLSPSSSFAHQQHIPHLPGRFTSKLFLSNKPSQHLMAKRNKHLIITHTFKCCFIAFSGLGHLGWGSVFQDSLTHMSVASGGTIGHLEWPRHLSTWFPNLQEVSPGLFTQFWKGLQKEGKSLVCKSFFSFCLLHICLCSISEVRFMAKPRFQRHRNRLHFWTEGAARQKHTKRDGKGLWKFCFLQQKAI